MKCPNCGFIFQKGDICPECGIDVIIFQKTKNASIKLYNKGLEQAKRNDFSGAVQSLEQSITFDKNNYKARNVVGLVYYETGQVADALKHWIISASLFHENNDAQRYIDSLQKNARSMEKMNDAVRMYNQAITYLNQKSEDLAVIQLKKAIDFNPKFVEAHNLLALCYLKQNNYGQAAEYIQAVLQIDAYNPTAIRYESELNPSNRKKSSKIEKGHTEGNKPASRTTTPSYKRHEYKQTVIGKNEVIAFVVGILCTAAVIMILILPAHVDAKNKTITQLQNKVAQLEGKAPKTADGSTDTVAKLQQEIDTLKKENEKYKAEADSQTKLLHLREAAAHLDKNEYEEAALLIISLDASSLEEIDKATYDTIKETAYPLAAKSFYTKGKGEFQNNNYTEAQGFLENSLRLASGEEFVDDAIYYLGKIAESKNDKETAKKYYERVINEFPQSNQLKNAQNSLNSLIS